ncbi:hypothetical protein DSL72_000456 [Monilinia vaccinii-corymbosi]|uniref:Protein kinase domain-containing protein n=1 Tax=Monilinia vaccinii-corymbosi TaxID=61207 RepID=A0A8A3P8I0_9HELO|nr:hypothetical protein DSL72_000456 [Monilinia vaccinii-corymbosi]
MEAPDFILESNGQGLNEETHAFHGNPVVATLTHEHPNTAQKFTIPIYSKDHLHVGRDSKCVIVSKKQFRIYTIIYDAERLDEYPPSVYCEDLESRNGTYVNDILIGILGNERIGRLLVDGDLIEVRPDWKFRYHQPRSKLIPHMALPEAEVQYFQDRFTISNHVLGSGIAGEVFLANNVGTSKQMACKVVKIKSSRSRLPSSQNGSVPGSRESNQQQDTEWENKSSLREIDILSKLNHPNIISIQKAFLSNDRLYMFTELATAGDLYTYFESCGNRLADAHARLITRQIALALEYLHSKGIAHRDVKMENILMTNTDIGSRVILTDFGLANYTDKTTGRLFSAVGTEGYVAPEIVGSGVSRGYTTAADMWSFGILTWSLLTGETSIPGGRLSQLEEIQVTKEFLSSDEKEAAQKWSYLHARTRSFLRGLLASDAEQRMTAVQTVNHIWYKKLPVSTALEQAYERAIRFWKPRDDSEDILAYLPGYTAPALDGAGPVRRKHLPDVSLSPYFNLDRHLQSRSPQVSKRKRILDDLKESGESFLESDLQQNVPKYSHRKICHHPIKSVSGIDLFGSYTDLVDNQAKNNTRPSYEISSQRHEISEAEMGQKAATRSLQNHLDSPIMDKNISSKLSNSKDTRTRKETDPANQEIHDTASQRVTKFCSAKVFKDEVNRVRKEQLIKA